MMRCDTLQLIDLILVMTCYFICKSTKMSVYLLSSYVVQQYTASVDPWILFFYLTAMFLMLLLQNCFFVIVLLHTMCYCAILLLGD